MGRNAAKNGVTKAPISAHPAFPAIVALWFAALLGLGSLVLPMALFETGMRASGLAGIIPGSEAPLGFTARALIALFASILGATLGIVLARSLARTGQREGEYRFEPASITGGLRKPLLAHDELGESGIEVGEDTSEEAASGKKRRSLAIAEEGGRSDYLYAVPLPGSAANDRPRASAPRQTETPKPAEEPAALELGEFVETTDETEFETTSAPEMAQGKLQSEGASPPSGGEIQDLLMTERQEFRPFQNPCKGTGWQEVPVAQSENAEKEGLQPPARGANPTDPLPFAAPSLQRRREELPADGSQELALDREERVEQAIPQVDVPPQLAAVPSFGGVAPTESPVEARPLEDLGLVQLAERLGSSIHKRRAWLAERREAAQSPATPRDIDLGQFEAAAAPEDAARAMADFFASTSRSPAHSSPVELAPPIATTPQESAGGEQVPAPLRELEPEELGDEEDDIAASLSLPIWDRAKPEDSDAVDLDEDAGDYSSLLAMQNPFKRSAPEFVRIEEPDTPDEEIEPTVTFPSALARRRETGPDDHRPFDPPPGARPTRGPVAPSGTTAGRRADKDQAESDLRSALSTLQRMSGLG